jgi:hypothetical protein
MSGPAAISAEQRRLSRTALVFPQATMAGGLIVFGAALFGLTVLVAGLPWALAGVAFIARSCSWVSPASGRLASLGRALGLFVALGSGLLIADTVQPDLWKGIGGWVPVGIVLSLWLLVVAVVLHLSEPTDLAPPAFGRLVAVRALLTLLAGYLLLYAAANAVDSSARCDARRGSTMRSATGSQAGWRWRSGSGSAGSHAARCRRYRGPNVLRKPL